MESVLEMMKAVGVRVKLQQFEPGGDISSWRQGKTGDWMCWATATATRPDLH
ncbi:hypothetical protein ACETU7_26415 [Rhodococcus sp. 3Y1]